jgi:signal transduction histidine kinase
VESNVGAWHDAAGQRDLIVKNSEWAAARRARGPLGVIALVVLAVVLTWLGLEQLSLASPPILGLLFAVGLLPSVILLIRQQRVTDQVVGQIELMAATLGEIASGNLERVDALPVGDGELGKLAGACRQLTIALEQQLQALEAARERAETSNAAKSSFLANMTHELRTPLNAIIGYAELVAEEIGDRGDDLGKLGTDIERILLSARHLLGLINDILDISKIEAGEMRVEIRRVDLARVLKDVRAAVELLIRKRGNQFVIEAEPNLGELDSDGLKIRQILINLLGNAAKFTDDGIVTLRVTRAGDDAVRFDVIDTGIGIPPGKLELLFEPFVQADASASRRFGGTGLGLTICRHFAEMIDATLTAESEPGKGSTFTLTVPRSRVASRGSRRAIRA